MIIRPRGLLPTVNRPGNSQHLRRGQVRICAGQILQWQVEANAWLLGTSSTGGHEEVNSFTYQFAGTSRHGYLHSHVAISDAIRSDLFSTTSEMADYPQLAVAVQNTHRD